jgi:hypothetical protein
MPKNDLVIPVWLPKDFLEFAQHTLADAFRDARLSQQDVLVPTITTERLNENLTLTLFQDYTRNNVATGGSANRRVRPPFSLLH